MSHGIYHHAAFTPARRVTCPEEGHPGQDMSCCQRGRGNRIPLGMGSTPAAVDSPQPAPGGIPPAMGRALSRTRSL